MKRFFVAISLLIGSPALISAQETVVLTLEKAIEIALSENVSVKVADMEIQRAEYAKKGTYAALYPQVDASAAYQRTIKKQVMYMDFDMGDLMGGAFGDDTSVAANTDSKDTGGGIEVGRWNTYSGSISAGMPLVNAQLWKSLKISAQDVELAVEKARSSRLETVTQVKQAFYAALLAKEVLNVYTQVYENAVDNFRQTEMRYNVDKASELDYTRAKANIANAVPNMFDAENSSFLSLWQLKAVMGIDLDTEIEVAGELGDYAEGMLAALARGAGADLSSNSTMRQLAIQAEELANMVKMQKYASLPSLALQFSYSMNAMTNDFNFSQYKWTPYSFVGLSLSVPIFAGGKRHAAVRQAQVQQDELRLQTENTERQLRIAIRQYLNQMETGMKSYTSAEEACNLAQKAYDIATKSYNIGRSTLTDLNDAQLTLTQARLGLCQSVYGYLVAKANLEQTLGYDFTE